MKRAIPLLFILLLPALIFGQSNQIAQSRPLVFRNVTLIDMTSEKPKPFMTVLISGNRIAALGKIVKFPKDARIIDADGKFLIPGLWDMHIHSFSDSGQEWIFPLLIIHGITGVRELGTRLPFEQIKQIRQEILEGKILGPRLGAVTSKILDGPGSRIRPSIVVETPDEARTLIREYKQQGIDFIKPYNLLSREVYLAVIDEAKRQKIPVAGHVPFSVTATEASDLGQTSIEHFTDIFLSCSRDEEALREERQQGWAKNLPIVPAGPIEIKAAASFDERKAAALFERFARNGTWMCPTIILSGTVPLERRREGDNRMKYIPSVTQEWWRGALNDSLRVLPNAEDRKMRHQRKLDIVSLMHRTGVGLLAGSDSPNPYVFPGFSLHEELELFVQAGLSPLEALRTATVNPARFLGKEKELGTIEKGKLADLVLLDANPLENIGNTKKINSVVLNGRFLDRNTLDKMLAEVETAVTKPLCIGNAEICAGLKVLLKNKRIVIFV